MYSGYGEGSQILKKIESEGNEVAIFIKDKTYKTVFDGLLYKVDDPESFINEDTIIIFDMSGNGEKAEYFKNRGNFVFGGSKFADNLEEDRNFGFDTMRRAGIQIPEYREFRDFKQGIDYVKSSDKRLVFKPNGSMPCKLTFCSDDSDQLVEYLKFVEKRFGNEIESFILQDFIEGVVISSELFCSDGQFVFPGNNTVEVKKSMNEDLGPSTGCSGNITWNSVNKIIENGVYKIRAEIEKERYTGQIDLNAVVNEDGIFGLEWTPRFGYDATPTYLTLINMEFGKFFSDAARGQLKQFDPIDEYAGSIRITIPPYPIESKINTEKVSPNEGIPIQNWEDYQDSLYFYEVMMEDNILVHSGGTGVVAISLGTSSNPEESLEEPYKIAKELKIPDKQYRTDLKEVLPKMIKEALEYA